jgi:hypothetical protein
VRAAEALKEQLQIDAELVEGKRGEFSIWVDDKRITRRVLFFFPNEEKIVAGVKAALT